ncbi:MFS transporter [Dermacoccus sp. Tok2021]|uniref:MFS transporter n=1 Tax=Dermacoccus sp. Tok2021 TaxID=2826873 RepID=UPI001CA6A0BF|nr:MFS transporter [Dermacoccus sp. Tok2021]MBZ4497881.1 MFS transporter [Dermacoccus sp. Tok2021]
MAAIAHTPARRLDDHPPISRGSLTVAGMSTIIEWYDFTLYLYMTTVISRVFFGGGTGGTAATLLVFAFTYLLRPVGAAVFGHIGDRIGRKPVLLISMALMTVAMLVTALLPTYASIGATAGWLMMAMRCLMSFSVGGEYSGVITYLVEGAEPKRRGFITSLASAASEVGGLMAVGLAALTTSFFTGPDLDSWGWRIPFFIGAIMAGATLLMRSRMDESPVFEEEDEDDKAKNPLVEVLRVEPGAVARGFAISALGSITYYVGIGYAPTFLQNAGKFSESDALWLGTAAAVAVILVTPFAGMAADRFGRRPILLLFGVLAAVTSLTMFQLMASGSRGAALTGALVLAAVAGGWSAVAASTIAEQFKSKARMSGMALGFTTATAIFGGFAPLVGERLIEMTDWKPAPGAMIAVVALCVLPVVWYQKETAPAVVENETH